MLVGYLVLTALGRDYRSQQLKRYAEAQGRQAPPRRPPLTPLRSLWLTGPTRRRWTTPSCDQELTSELAAAVRRGDPGEVGVVGGEAEPPVERHRGGVALLDLEERVRSRRSAAPQSASAGSPGGQPLPAGRAAAPRSGEAEPAALRR